MSSLQWSDGLQQTHLQRWGFALWVVLFLLSPAAASAFEFATDTGQPDGNQLRWELGEEIHFTQHVDPGGTLPAWLLHSEARRAFQSWASVPESRTDFVEDPVFAGVECPHALPEDSSAEDSCGGGLPPHDFRSALFFIETVWPFGEEVIALTTLSWQEGGQLVDADISFNGVDYNWTVSEESVQVDFQSIALHEIGHFLGLAHSSDPDAVMRVDYEEGQLVRTLGADDRAGIAALYPCNAPPCVGSIAVNSGGCSMTGHTRLGLVGLLMAVALLLLSLRSERGRRAVIPALLLCAVVLLPTRPRSSTVVGLDIEGLTERAERVVRAEVVSSESWREGIVWTRVTLDVTEDWLGEGSDRIELVQPGGVLPGLGTLVFGMPKFDTGEDVVVFLKGDRVLGLTQGKFSVVEDGTVRRDLRELSFARVGGHRAPRELVAPETLDSLRRSVVVDDL